MARDCESKRCAADYKNYIFSALFLKRLSDRFDEEIEAAVASGLGEF